MRIGQYTDSFLPIVDGVGRVVLSYAQTLGRMKHPCYVFAPMADMGYLGDYPFQVIDYNTMQMPGRMPYRVGLPQLDAQFEKRVRMTRLDIVHVHSPFMLGRSGLRLAKRRGLPVVGTFHSKFYDDFRQTLKSEALARFGTKQVVEFFEKCDEVWAVSETSARTLRDYGYDREIIVMPNGTDLRELDDAVIPELKARYAIGDGEHILLYVGQINWKKNILRILEAVKLLKEEGLAFRMLLAGQGPHHDEILHKINELGIGDRTRLIGHIGTTRELDGLYALSKMFVFPSLYDNAPMVVREAAAMGTPPVLIKGSNAAECAVDGVSALMCEDTAASLAEAIRRGLSGPEALLKMGQAARDTIPVPWTALMGSVVARYEALIAAKAAGKAITANGRTKGRIRLRR